MLSQRLPTSKRPTSSCKWSVQLWRTPGWDAAKDVQSARNLQSQGDLPTSCPRGKTQMSDDHWVIFIIYSILCFFLIYYGLIAYYKSIHIMIIIGYTYIIVYLCSDNYIFPKRQLEHPLPWCPGGRPWSLSNCWTAVEAKLSLAMDLQLWQLIKINSTSWWLDERTDHVWTLIYSLMIY